MSLIESLS